MTIPVSRELQPTTDRPPPSSVPAYLISALLIVIGISAIGFFLYSITQDDGIQFALDWVVSEDYPDEPSVILAFLERFGIIVPALVLYLGTFLIVIGLKLRSGHIRIAQWARLSLFWMSVALIALTLLNVYNLIRDSGGDDTSVSFTTFVGDILPFIVGFVVVAGVLYWMNNNITRVFHGEDLLIARETRLAWNLLIPTLAIFILVAARPLEQTFIRSLTDKRFAGTGYHSL